MLYFDLFHFTCLHEQVFPQRPGGVDPLYDGVRAGVFESHPGVLYGFSEHAHDEVSVEDVLPRVHVSQRDVRVVIAVAPEAVLPDLDVGGAGRDSHDMVVAVPRDVVDAPLLLAGGIVPAAYSAPVYAKKAKKASSTCVQESVL